MDKVEKRTVDRASQQMLKRAEKKNILTAWDRLEIMQPQCGFGQLGICCRNCSMGPCRIDPFAEEEQTGVCGASADTIVARNFIRIRNFWIRKRSFYRSNIKRKGEVLTR